MEVGIWYKKHYGTIRKIFKSFLPFIGLICVFVLFHYTNLIVLKYYPVCMNFGWFLLFFISIFKEETAVHKIAKVVDPDITALEFDYTRKLNYAWSTFCFFNFLISLATVYMSEFVWCVYNGCISYMMVGIMFGTEYLIRKRFKQKHGI